MTMEARQIALENQGRSIPPTMETKPRPQNDYGLTLLDMLLHDLRGGLVSLAAVLKLLTRGYYGRIDHTMENPLNELLLKTVGLIGMTEEYLGNNSLLYAGSETGSQAFDLARDILNPTLDELLQDRQGHRILIAYPPGLSPESALPVHGSKIGLKAVFRNLLKNAFTYGKHGESITVSIETHDLWWQVSVSNSGRPVPAEYRDELFRKVPKIPKDRGHEWTGLGIGLALAKEIIERHGGSVWYEAKQDGSTFAFTLPKAQSEPKEAKNQGGAYGTRLPR
jgi:signal transduction histidine kinase